MLRQRNAIVSPPVALLALTLDERLQRGPVRQKSLDVVVACRGDYNNVGEARPDRPSRTSWEAGAPPSAPPRPPGPERDEEPLRAWPPAPASCRRPAHSRTAADIPSPSPHTDGS